MALIVPKFFLSHWCRTACIGFFSWFQCAQTVFKLNTILYRNQLFTDEFHYLKWIMKCTEIVDIYNQKSEHIDSKGLTEVTNKLIFNNLHNPPPATYVDTIINPLYLKQLLNLVRKRISATLRLFYFLFFTL